METLRASNSFWILPVELELGMCLTQTPCHFVMLSKFWGIIVAKDGKLVSILSTIQSILSAIQKQIL